MIIDCLFPNFIFTTILDVDFDSHSKCSYKKKQVEQQKQQLALRHQQLSNLQIKQQQQQQQQSISLSASKAMQVNSTTSDSETIVRRNSTRKRHSTVKIEMPLNSSSAADISAHAHADQLGSANSRETLKPAGPGKNLNLKSTDHQTRRLTSVAKDELVSRRLDGQPARNHQVRL